MEAGIKENNRQGAASPHTRLHLLAVPSYSEPYSTAAQDSARNAQSSGRHKLAGGVAQTQRAWEQGCRRELTDMSLGPSSDTSRAAGPGILRDWSGVKDSVCSGNLNLLFYIQQKQKRRQLTGKQNSSKAGLTNVMYCDKICSRSRPLSLMSLNTGREKQENVAETQHTSALPSATRLLVTPDEANTGLIRGFTKNQVAAG